jgi:activating signal cointegrator complex subunit 1
LRERLSEFATALQESRPPITGLDPTVFINPRQVHLRLGVMSLRENPQLPDYPNFMPNQPNTLASALSLLTSLKPQIATILGEHKLRVPLHTIGPRGPDQSRIHSVWLGPRWEEEEGRRLYEVGGAFFRLLFVCVWMGTNGLHSSGG